MEIWYMETLMGPFCLVSDIHSKYFWQFTNTVALETVTSKFSFRHNFQADDPTPIVLFLLTYNLISFFKPSRVQNFRLAWFCFIYPQFIYILHP